MNRIIKFRAWDKENKKIVNWEEIRPQSMLWLDRPNTEFEYMQFTGLLNKDGKEIYEGDIIKDVQGDIREIIFDGGGYWCKYPNGDRFMPSEKFREIIGNIYENPELLTHD